MGEETVKQRNMESITSKAVPLLHENADPGQMDNDWIMNFFDKSRMISDDHMQNLWAKILAGEANLPGSYSKATINLLQNLDKRDLEHFQNLCRFGWIVGEFLPLVFDSTHKIYVGNGVSFDTLKHLDDIGLIRYDSVVGFRRIMTVQCGNVSYGESVLTFYLPATDNKLPIGEVTLSRAGIELYQLCNSPPVEGFFEYVQKKWKKYLKPPKVQSQPKS